MDLMLLRVFQRQVTDQCRFVSTSVPVINQAAASGDHDQLWIGCQMFVVGAGNVSKALWGQGRSRNKTAPARQPLRDSLAVDDTSPLYEVDMRNTSQQARKGNRMARLITLRNDQVPTHLVVLRMGSTTDSDNALSQAC